ncbi:hypothetical protein SAMN05421858_5108 [Haladaptatus litoreus]|uniref:Uncharacterized protein n=1 Tax=Haladaptatus litoreus TaxID=553468 RepID=A0A1N7FIX7_9EURY|nr:hypothetical protein [Haladaptatus litoreus]SIS00234.1 hypothetical protein SAMN05421858_5108 [Haladaptatus litoreus]
MPSGTPNETCGDHGGSNREGNPCGRSAGWGTDFESGKCRNHRGTSPDGESHENNQNAQTHGLFSKHDGYYHDLDEDEQEWVFDFTNSLLDRLRKSHGKEPDMFDKEALKNIAIDFHRVAHANGYFREKGEVQTQWASTMEGRVPMGDEVNVWASEIRQYNESIYRRMQKHGLLDDPESQKADALSDLTVEIKPTRVTEENVDEFVGE